MDPHLIETIFGAGVLTISAAAFLVMALTAFLKVRQRGTDKNPEETQFGQVLTTLVSTIAKFDRVADAVDQSTMQMQRNTEAYILTAKNALEQMEAMESRRAGENQAMLKRIEDNTAAIANQSVVIATQTTALNQIGPSIEGLRADVNTLIARMTAILEKYDQTNGELNDEVRRFNDTVRSIDAHLKCFEELFAEEKKKKQKMIKQSGTEDKPIDDAISEGKAR